MENRHDFQAAVLTWLQDLEVEDISLSSLNGLAYYKNGAWTHRAVHSVTELGAFVRDIAFHIAEHAGVTLSSRHPSLDAHLEAYQGLSSFRAHVVVPPLSGSGTQITLRRLRSDTETLSLAAFPMPAADELQLRAAMRERQNILVCGPTGSGKTSLMKALLAECDKSERVAILEDSAELTPPNAVSFSLRARANRFSSVEGSTWNLEQLVYEALRMRPERIVLGECRGPEALGLLHAIQSGHRGVMCTLHASSETQALERYQNLVRLASSDAVQMASARWDLVVVIALDGQHQRRVSLHPQTRGITR